MTVIVAVQNCGSSGLRSYSCSSCGLLRPLRTAIIQGNKTFVVQDPADGCVARDPGLVLLDFENANLTINDMGGSGMRFANVGTTPNGRLIDLAVSNLTTYEAWRPQQNGKKGGFGAINSKAPRPRQGVDGTILELRFEFLEFAHLAARRAGSNVPDNV